MAERFDNPWCGRGLPGAPLLPSTDAAAPARLLALCPAHAETPLVAAPGLADATGLGALWLKDERARMGLGSFKALGAAYVLADLAAAARAQSGAGWDSALQGRVFATASAGNHGLSVAAGARLFGARAAIFLAETVPEAFAARLRAKAARVVRAGADYAASMEAAEAAAARNGWTLLSDSSWPGYTELPRKVMEGYLQLADEAARQVPAAPDLIVLQAGVGGLAAAVAAHARAVWGAGPRIVVVEPDRAPALLESARAGRAVTVSGPASAMGRLDCKTPSVVALAGLARDADCFVSVTEAEAAAAVAALAGAGFDTTPSGAAGVAALLARRAGARPGDRVLAILSEGPADG
jgi:diaminopropionate ammonia-lyase